MSEDAWIQFLEVIARDPRMAGAFNNMAILEERLGYHRAAEAHYRRAIALKHEFPDAHFNLGMLLLRPGSVPRGVSRVRVAVADQPVHALSGCRIRSGTAVG